PGELVVPHQAEAFERVVLVALEMLARVTCIVCRQGVRELAGCRLRMPDKRHEPLAELHVRLFASGVGKLGEVAQDLNRVVRPASARSAGEIVDGQLAVASLKSNRADQEVVPAADMLDERQV